MAAILSWPQWVKLLQYLLHLYVCVMSSSFTSTLHDYYNSSGFGFHPIKPGRYMCYVLLWPSCPCFQFTVGWVPENKQIHFMVSHKRSKWFTLDTVTDITQCSLTITLSIAPKFRVVAHYHYDMVHVGPCWFLINLQNTIPGNFIQVLKLYPMAPHILLPAGPGQVNYQDPVSI